ncbi:FKBP-type peptidyl-prolyl cis-trans isomerase [uncultured Hymenobacter sp.]|uniref:FKBP-type peptidyl-prolyl cis-trans isomerase n=1 Tax=uncultured Hymenobacter sp. TaxID=170016 RepID=UPI0035C98A06
MKKLLFPFFAVLLLLAGAGSALVGCKDPSTSFNQAALDRENKYRVIDDSIIQAYLARHNYGPGSYTRTDAGLYLVALTAKPEGAVAATGKRVAIKYIGRLIQQEREDIIFETSIDGQTLCDCRTYTVGAAPIAGWNQGLPLMHAGERKLLLVPSYLAYQRNGKQNSIIDPDTPLIFDMEILSVQ